MARRNWQGGVDAAQAAGETVGRLQVFKLAKRGGFELVNEVQPIGRKAAARVARPRDGISEFRSGQIVVRFSRDPLVLEAFKDWRASL